MRMGLPDYTLISFFTDFYRCFPLNTTSDYLLMVLGEKLNMKPGSFAMRNYFLVNFSFWSLPSGPNHFGIQN